MPAKIIYRQTIKPIALLIEGWYKLIIFQLYPFVLKRFFNITAKDTNDDCYDLHRIEKGERVEQELISVTELTKRIEIISTFLFTVFSSKKVQLDFTIRQSIQLILDNKAQINNYYH